MERGPVLAVAMLRWFTVAMITAICSITINPPVALGMIQSGSPYDGPANVTLGVVAAIWWTAQIPAEQWFVALDRI
jgi:hypothetical protein